jgi:ADP-heptose:LPS heptosyltransferase
MVYSVYDMNKRGKRIFKLFDRYLGIPILYSLGLFKRKRKLQKNISTIGILTVPAIGDIILLNGLLSDIKDFNYQIKIILFVTREVTEIAEIMNSYDELVNIELYKPLKAIKTLRHYPVVVLIDSSQWARLNAILTFFSKSEYKIGFKKAFKYGVGKDALVWKWLFKKRKTKVIYELFEMFTVPFIQMINGVIKLKFQLIPNNIAILTGRMSGLVKTVFTNK